MTTTADNSTASIATELVSLCREGRNAEAVDKFYSPHIVSIESSGTAEMPAEMTGIDAIREKHKWWEENNEIHGVEINGPFIGEDQFAVHYVFDTTFKPAGQRSKMEEMAMYKVKDGKVVHEHFFYNVPSA